MEGKNEQFPIAWFTFGHGIITTRQPALVRPAIMLMFEIRRTIFNGVFVVHVPVAGSYIIPWPKSKPCDGKLSFSPSINQHLAIGQQDGLVKPARGFLGPPVLVHVPLDGSYSFGAGQSDPIAAQRPPATSTFAAGQ